MTETKSGYFWGDNEKIMVIIEYGSMHFQMNSLRYVAINPTFVDANWHAIWSLSPLSPHLIAAIFLRSCDSSISLAYKLQAKSFYSIQMTV